MIGIVVQKIAERNIKPPHIKTPPPFLRGEAGRREGGREKTLCRPLPVKRSVVLVNSSKLALQREKILLNPTV